MGAGLQRQGRQQTTRARERKSADGRTEPRDERGVIFVQEGRRWMRAAAAAAASVAARGCGHDREESNTKMDREAARPTAQRHGRYGDAHRPAVPEVTSFRRQIEAACLPLSLLFRAIVRRVHNAAARSVRYGSIAIAMRRRRIGLNRPRLCDMMLSRPDPTLSRLWSCVYFSSQRQIYRNT